MASTNSTTSIDPWYLILDFLASLPVAPGRLEIFIALIALLVPSIFCSIYLFFQFIKRRELLRRSTNSVVICLLIMNFLQATTDLPMMLVFLKTKRVAIYSYSFCVTWGILEEALSCISLWLMAFGSVERYLFIFHSAILKKHKFILRYIPIACCILEPCCFFTVLSLFPPGCRNIFHSAINTCGGACFNMDPIWSSLSVEFNLTLPLCIVVIGNFVLLIRVFQQKRRMQQRNVWAKNARMLIQLVSVATLYSVCWLPIVISMQMIALNFQSQIVAYLTANYLQYLQYFSVLLSPFASIVGLPELHDQLRGIFRRGRTPMTATVFEMKANETVRLEQFRTINVQQMGKSAQTDIRTSE